MLQERSTPRRRAFAPWRQVSRTARSRIAEPHRYDRYQSGIVEGVSTDAHPPPQPVAARVVERNARLVYPAARSLTGDQDPGPRAYLNDRTGSEGKVRFADCASTDFAKEDLELGLACHDGTVRRPFIVAW